MIYTRSESLFSQGTVIFVLNHLKLVSTHQMENRMTSSNLAVCFGPIFIPPSGMNSLNSNGGGGANGMRFHIDVLTYIMDIWPQSFNTNNNIVI